MERKTTQRIIGILIVAALIVVLMPLLFNGNSSSSTTQTAEAKAPPFPSRTTEPAAPSTTTVAAQAPVAPAATSTPTPAPTAVAASTSVSQQPQVATPDTNATTTAAVASTPTAESIVPTSSNQPLVSATPVSSDSLDVPTTPSVATAPVEEGQSAIPTTHVSAEPVNAAPKVKHTKTLKLVQSRKDLVKLKNTAWVVQMGSFKVKSNAEHLVNQLRAQGFKAFTKEVKSAMRVYVGPEFKQASAASLADKIQQDMNMHGIVVPYRPLEL